MSVHEFEVVIFNLVTTGECTGLLYVYVGVAGFIVAAEFNSLSDDSDGHCMGFCIQNIAHVFMSYSANLPLSVAISYVLYRLTLYVVTWYVLFIDVKRN